MLAGAILMSWLISSGQLEYMALYSTTQSHASDLVDNNHLTLQQIKRTIIAGLLI